MTSSPASFHIVGIAPVHTVTQHVRLVMCPPAERTDHRRLCYNVAMSGETVTEIAVSPSGQLAAAVDQGPEVYVWDLTERRETGSFTTVRRGLPLQGDCLL